MNAKKTLGILGGMGPMATVQFYKNVVAHTLADRDADHINIIITSRADIPDRTDYILGKSSESPLPKMIADAKTLADAGAEIIAIPCNTARYFHAELEASVSVPVLDIVRETAEHVMLRGFKRAAILGTIGTIKIGAYKRALEGFGVEGVEPDDDTQSLITSVIYDYVKAGRPGGERIFDEAARRMFERGCDCLILGCTELPLAANEDVRFVDSLEVLAYRSIVLCGGTPTRFETEFLSAYEKKNR